MSDRWLSSLFSGIGQGVTDFVQARQQKRQYQDSQRRYEQARQDHLNEADYQNAREDANNQRAFLMGNLDYLPPEQRAEAIRRAGSIQMPQRGDFAGGATFDRERMRARLGPIMQQASPGPAPAAPLADPATLGIHQAVPATPMSDRYASPVAAALTGQAQPSPQASPDQPFPLGGATFSRGHFLGKAFNPYGDPLEGLTFTNDPIAEKQKREQEQAKLKFALDRAGDVEHPEAWLDYYQGKVSGAKEGPYQQPGLDIKGSGFGILPDNFHMAPTVSFRGASILGGRSNQQINNEALNTYRNDQLKAKAAADAARERAARYRAADTGRNAKAALWGRVYNAAVGQGQDYDPATAARTADATVMRAFGSGIDDDPLADDPAPLPAPPPALNGGALTPGQAQQPAPETQIEGPLPPVTRGGLPASPSPAAQRRNMEADSRTAKREADINKIETLLPGQKRLLEANADKVIEQTKGLPFERQYRMLSIKIRQEGLGLRERELLESRRHNLITETYRKDELGLRDLQLKRSLPPDVDADVKAGMELLKTITAKIKANAAAKKQQEATFGLDDKQRKAYADEEAALTDQFTAARGDIQDLIRAATGMPPRSGPGGAKGNAAASAGRDKFGFTKDDWTAIAHLKTLINQKTGKPYTDAEAQNAIRNDRSQ